MNDLVVVKTFNSRPEAEVAKSNLDANKIFSVITADDEGGMAPFPMQVSSEGVKLMVKKEDLDKATELCR